MLAIDPLNSETLYAGTDGGIFKSTDGGRTWRCPPRGAGQRVIGTRCSCSIRATPRRSTQVPAKRRSQEHGLGPKLASLGRGHDRGRGREIAAPSPRICLRPRLLAGPVQAGDSTAGDPSSGAPAAADLSVLAVDPQSPETLYVATDDGRIFETRDGGDSWRSLQAPSSPKTTEITALVVDPQNPQHPVRRHRRLVR